MPYAAPLPIVGPPAPARVAFIDSGIGLLGYADALRSLRPDLELVLALDPDHMPYGPRPHDEVRELVVQRLRGALVAGGAA